MKISNACLLVLLAIGSIGILKYGREAYNSLRDFQMVQRLDALAGSNTLWSDATVALSLERSVTQVALSLPDPAPGGFVDLIREQRDLSNRLFDEAVEGLAKVGGFPTEAEFRQRAQELRAGVEGMRAEVDQMLALPASRRPDARPKDLPFELKAEILKLKSLSNFLLLDNNLTSSNASSLASIKDAAWEIREFGGRARTYYAIATLNGTSIPPDMRGLVLADSARAASAWNTIGNLLRVAEVESDFTASIEAAGDRYFGSYLPVLTQLDAAMAGSTPDARVDYPIDFESFFALSNEALDGMTQLSRDTGLVLRAYWATKRQTYLQKLIFDVSFVVLDILLVFASLYFVSTKIASRIEYASKAVEAVANGHLDDEVDARKGDLHELKNLTTSLTKFIHSAREARKMAATLASVEEQEQQRLRAEKEREERIAAEAEATREREAVAAQEAQRLRAFTTFQSEMEHVLGEAASGNFSNRMSATIEDASLAGLAGVINKLLEATETNIADIVTSIDALAQGNLGVRIEGDRQGAFLQMQEDFNAALTTLAHSMGQIMQSGQTVSATSSELESSSLSMAKRAEDSAASIEETSAAAEQIATSIRQVVVNAKAADEATRRVRLSVDKTRQVSDETEASINAMTEASAQINRVVKVIQDIAFQINLLALNAGVEAARAGEVGRGFSVVASEVHALAQRSQEAVREISDVIEENNRSVRTGVEQVALSRRALEEIIAEVGIASGQISDIATAVEQQSLGIEEINSAVRAIDSAAQTNAAALEETTAASVALSQEAKALSQALGQFHGVSDRLDAGRPANVVRLARKFS